MPFKIIFILKALVLLVFVFLKKTDSVVCQSKKPAKINLYGQVRKSSGPDIMHLVSGCGLPIEIAWPS
jgi:hypothetical protein